MNAAQRRMYWAEWKACKAVLMRRGYDYDEAEERRHAIHIETLGVDKSSKDLTNGDLDALLGVFRSFTRGGDLNEQLRIIDQPEQRAAAFRDRAHKLAESIGIEPPGRAAYLDQLARRVVGRPFAELGDTELMRICGILRAQQQRKAKRVS